MPRMGFELALVLAAVAVALALRPWRLFGSGFPLHAWLACLVLLPWLWASQRVLPGGVALQMSGASLLVLMFGWPLAVLSLVPVALGGAWFAGLASAQALNLLAWNGIAVATLSLALGLATRRWLPRHPFVFILGRGFIVTALATMAAGTLASLATPLPPGTDLATLLVGRWLMAWGEAFATGMLTAIFVAFRPQWLATWSDARYLPRS
jgi:uncharacterized membrane protein